jgi:hypothetical protein
MNAHRASIQKLLNLNPQAEWAEMWHLWNAMIPRRSITGRLIHGRVWRRRDGQRWIYKTFIEFALDRTG